MATQTDRRPWGSTAPYISMDEAFSVAEKFYAQAAGQGSLDVLSRILGNSVSSSSFARKLAALKLYSLVDEPTKGSLALTQLGTAIAAPLSTEQAAQAKKETFLRVKVFGQVHERHKGKLLPADEFLKNMLEQEAAVPKEVSSDWVAAFRSSIRAAGLLHDRGDGKLQVMESPIVESAPKTAPQEPVRARMELPSPVPVTSNGDDHTQQRTGHTTRIELMGGRYATFSIPDRLSSGDVRKLKAMLAGLGAIIESLAAEPEEDSP